MQQKYKKLSGWSFVLAVVIFVISYVLYHYTLPGDAFTAVWQPQSGKPWVTLLFPILGVLFLFASILSLLVGHIFFSSEESGEIRNCGNT